MQAGAVHGRRDGKIEVADYIAGYVIGCGNLSGTSLW